VPRILSQGGVCRCAVGQSTGNKARGFLDSLRSTLTWETLQILDYLIAVVIVETSTAIGEVKSPVGVAMTQTLETLKLAQLGVCFHLAAHRWVHLVMLMPSCRLACTPILRCCGVQVQAPLTTYLCR
jgi:hypothetical protein